MTEFAILDATPNQPGSKTSNTEDPSATDGQPTHDKAKGGSGVGSLGYLLDETDDKKRAKYVHKQLWGAQEKAAKNRSAVWAVNSARRDGDPFARVKKEGIDEDVVYSFYRPKGSENTPPSLNKTDDLCIKVVSQLLVDPPSPECEPASDEDGDRDKAEFSERVLKDILSESGINGTEAVRDATDLGCAHGSGFIWAYTDPFGGGYRPKEIMASMAATTVDDALFVQAPPEPGMVPPGALATDAPPLPGTPATQGATDTTPIPQPEPYVIRYVKADQTLTDEPGEADIEWLPRVQRRILTGNNVRLLPDTATDIREADGAVIALGLPLGYFKACYPETVGKMSPEDLRKLCKFRPERWRALVAKHVRPDVDQVIPKVPGQDEGPPDQTLVFVYYTFYKSTPQYKKGCYVLTSGEEFTLEKSVWTHKVERKEKTHEVPMDVPVAQFRQFKDVTAGDPYGKGLVDKIGDGDPLLAIALGALVEYLPMALRPHKFVPIGSGITAKDLALPRDIPIPFNGSAGIPVIEKISPFPKEALELYDRTSALMDSRSGLNDIAQGSDQSEQSGRSRAQAVEQALVAVSGMKRGLDDGFVRLCRIILQLVKRDYTTPQKLKIVGEGGSYKVKEWTGAELGDTTDVKIQAGTSTMLPLSAKMQMASDEFTLMAPIDPTSAVEKYRRVTSGHLDPILSVEDDPIAEEIKRSIGQWKEGQPDQWAPPQPPTDALGQPLVDPNTGQPVPPPPDPANPFVRLPHHLEQDVAIKRHDELRRSMATVDFSRHQPEWQQLLLVEYDAMKQAAGIATVAEQQMAEQQQQEAASQQAQGAQESQQGAEAQAQASQQDATAQQAAADQQASGDQQQQKHENEMEKERFKATANLATAAMKQSSPK